MANTVKTVTNNGNTIAYAITDTAGNVLTVTVTVATTAATANLKSAFSGGPLLQDGMNALAQLALMLGSGQTP